MKRRFRRRPAHWVTLAVLAALFIGGRVAHRHYFAPPRDDDYLKQQLPEGEYALERAVDGDTIIILARGQRIRVRLLAVDSPEIFKRDADGRVHSDDPDPFAREASEFTQAFVTGKRVRLQFGRRRVDQYGRLLAFVFVNDALLNEELVRAGLAKANVYPGDESSLTTRIVNAQREAQRAGRGMWAMP